MAQSQKQAKKPTKKSKAALSDDKLIAMWRDMARIRRFEERCGQVYAMGQIGGFCHLYIGQEAVVVGLQAVAQTGDQVITGYRDHAHMLACGMEPKGVMAELTGRSGGYSNGKGGSMHMFSLEKRFFGGHGIVGANVSLGTGIAFGHKYSEDGGLCLTYYGDGAANQGQVAESLNMAALWKLPVVYVIENNRYAMGTSVIRSSAQSDFSKRGLSFNIPGEQVDGMDIRAVKAAGEAAQRAVERIGRLRRRLGGGVGGLRGGVGGGIGGLRGGLRGGVGRGVDHGVGRSFDVLRPRGVRGGDGEDTGGELGGVAGRGGAANDGCGATGTDASRRGCGDPPHGGCRRRCHDGHDYRSDLWRGENGRGGQR